MDGKARRCSGVASDLALSSAVAVALAQEEAERLLSLAWETNQGWVSGVGALVAYS